MECSRDAELDEPRPGRRIGGQRSQLIFGARGDDLAAAVVVGRSSRVQQGRRHVFWITTDDGRHRRGGSGAGPAITRPARVEDPPGDGTPSRRGRDFADGMTRNADSG
jgi:hypothetical protein